MMSKIIKIIGIVILAAVIIGGVIILVPKLSSPKTTSTGSLTSARQAGATVPGNQELIAILQSVNSISLPDAILRDPAFRSLTDISLSINRSNSEGRTNPFADLRTFSTVPQSTTFVSNSAAVETP